MIKQALRSSIFQFISAKYFTYALQFINALLIAKYLGLFYFGIFGFVTLVLQYLSYSNFGVQHSLNVLISTEKNINIINTGLLLSNASLVSIITGILIFMGLILSNTLGFLDPLDKYLFTKYYYILIPISILQNIKGVYVNIYRIYNKLDLINLSNILPALFQLASVFIFRGIELFWALLFSLLISHFIIVLLFWLKSPVPVYLKYNKPALVILIKKGFFLLVYNLSFYLIMLSARTIVSYFYDVVDFALFNFANSISTAIMMLVGSISFLIFPKLLNKFSNIDINETIRYIEKIRKVYLSSAFFIFFSSIAFLPLVFKIIPSFKDSIDSIIILLIAQLIISNSFGYSALLIQKGEEKRLTLFGFISVSIVLLLGTFSVRILDLNFDSVAVTTVISVIVYNFFIFLRGNKITKQFSTIQSLLKYLYNYKYFLPLLIYIILYLLIDKFYLNILITIGLYIIINYKDLIYSLKQAKQLLLNNEFLDIMSND